MALLLHVEGRATPLDLGPVLEALRAFRAFAQAAPGGGVVGHLLWLVTAALDEERVPRDVWARAQQEARELFGHPPGASWDPHARWLLEQITTATADLEEYSEDQPRAPEGSPEGGQGLGGAEGQDLLEGERRVLRNFWQEQRHPGVRGSQRTI